MNAGLPSSQVSRYCRQLESLLRKAGAETRYFRDREKGETAFGLIMDAVRFLVNGTYSRFPVVNGEFTAYEHGLPEVLHRVERTASLTVRPPR